MRKSIPFDYVGPSTNAAYILITFTTNKIPGGGSAGDEVLIDDVELIYNSTADLINTSDNKWIGYNTNTGIFISDGFKAEEIICITSLMGQQIVQGTVKDLNGTHLKSGMYIVSHPSGSSKIFSE